MINSEFCYAIINEDWVLRGWKGFEYALVNYRTGEMIFLPEEERFVINSCDGKHNFASALYLPLHRTILQKYIDLGIVRTCDKDSAQLDPAQQYRFAPCPVTKSVLWSLTNNCNFKCKHCYMEAPKRTYRETTTEELFSILDMLEQANVNDISFTGGEPFLRPEIMELLRRMRKKRINITEIFSNASLITDSLLDEIEKIGYKPVFKVSFDCVGTHNYMRGVPNAEEDTLRGIKTLINRGYKVIIISSVDTVVLPHIPKTLDTLIDLGVESWWIAPPIEVGNWKSNNSKSTVRETVEALKNLTKLWVEKGRPIDLLLWYFGLFKRKGSETLHQGNGRLFTSDGYECLASKYYPYISPDGRLMPCGSYIGTDLAKDMPCILDSSYIDAWSDPKLRYYCDLKKEEILSYSLQCKNCKHFPDCGSGCRIASFIESGNYFNREMTKCAVFKGGYFDEFIAYVEELVRNE